MDIFHRWSEKKTKLIRCCNFCVIGIPKKIIIVQWTRKYLIATFKTIRHAAHKTFFVFIFFTFRSLERLSPTISSFPFAHSWPFFHFKFQFSIRNGSFDCTKMFQVSQIATYISFLCFWWLMLHDIFTRFDCWVTRNETKAAKFESHRIVGAREQRSKNRAACLFKMAIVRHVLRSCKLHLNNLLIFWIPEISNIFYRNSKKDFSTWQQECKKENNQKRQNIGN